MTNATTVLDRPVDRTQTLPRSAAYLAPVGRVLYSLIFLSALAGHFRAGTIAFAPRRACLSLGSWCRSRGSSLSRAL